MTDEIINPFKNKKTDWVKLSQRRFEDKKEYVEIENKKQNDNTKKSGNVSKPSKPVLKESKKEIKRVAKSFKIYPGEISRNFDKRVNKMQVKFDDLGFDKNYVDSGKYMMFLMSLSEKYNLHELYSEVDEKGNINIDEKELKKLFS